MAKYGFDPSKYARWHIPIADPIAPILIGAFDEKTNCIGINLRWITWLIVCSDILADRRTYENPTQEQMDFIQQQVGLIQARLLRSEDCTDIEDCPDPPAPTITKEESGECYRILVNGEPATGWICPEIIEIETIVPQYEGCECEEDEMAGCGENIKNWKFVDGVLNIRTCDGWEAVPGQVGASLGAAGISSSDIGLQEWEGAGKPPLSAGKTPVPSDNPFYTTNDSLACAKATAFVESIKQWMQDTRDGIEESGLSLLGLITFFESILGGLGLIGEATAAGSLVFSIVVGTSMESSLDAFDEALAGIDWDGVICDAVPLMSPIVMLGIIKANQATEEDYWNVVQLIKADFDLAPKVLQFVNYFPISVIQTDVRKRLPTQDCGCSDFLPYGYVPPVTEGCFLPEGSITGDQNLGSSPVTGEFVFVGHFGSGSGESWSSAFQFASGGLNYDTISILLEGNLPFSLSDLKVTYSTAVSYSGGSADPVAVWLWRYDAAANTWYPEYFATNWADGSTPIDRIINSMSSSMGDKWAFEMRSVGASAQGRNPLTITALTISGTAENDPTDVGFVDLPIGDEACM